MVRGRNRRSVNYSGHNALQKAIRRMTDADQTSRHSRGSTRLGWYWRRLRAMSVLEVAFHVRKKMRQRADRSRRPITAGLRLETSDEYPPLPDPTNAPPIVLDALRRDSERIMAGHWHAFGYLDL